jgi:hypothetical protein
MSLKLYKKALIARMWNGDKMETLLAIDSGYFYAGVEVGRRAAPIIRYMASWSESKIREYCTRKGWKCLVISPEQFLQLDDELEGTPKTFLPSVYHE